MGSLDAKLQQITRLGWVRSVARIVAVSVPFGVSAMTFIQGLTDAIPLSVIITLAMLALASCAVLFNQLAIIAGVPITVSMPDDYAHGLGLGNLWLGYEPTNEAECLQLGITLHNATPKPMLYAVKRFDASVSDRIVPAEDRISGGGLIKATRSVIFKQASFKRAAIADFFGTKQSGLIELEVLYGHPDRAPSRRYHATLLLTLSLKEDRVGATYVFREETDEQII